MKKLTAGIFATILGLTAMGAADAAVTSRAYVDAAIKSVEGQAGQVATDLATLTGRVDTAEDDIDAVEGRVGTAESKITALEEASATHATKTELEEGLEEKQDTLTATNVVRGDEIDAGTGQMKAAGNVISGITAVNGVVTYTTASVATSEGLAELQGTVADLETNKANAADVYTRTEVDDLQTAQNAAIKADYEAADTGLQTQITANKTSIDNLDTTYATEAEAKAFADAKDAEIEAAQKQADKGVADAATAQAAAEAAAAAAATADGKAVEAQADATEALNALDQTSKLADGDYTLTMKVVDGVAKYGWEYIDRTFEAGEDASAGDSLAHDETTTQG